MRNADSDLQAIREAKDRAEAEVLYERLACVTIPAISHVDPKTGYAIHRALRTLLEEKIRLRWLPVI